MQKPKPQKKQADRVSPCGSNCPDFVAKTCPGDDPRCALYWRFTQGVE